MFESGDYPAAVKQLASAAELNPHLTQLQSLYGRALLNTGDPQAASEAFRKELSTNPNDYQANLGLAQIDIARKQFGGALQPAELALRGRPDSPEAKLAVAECLAGTHQFKEALPHAEGATVNMPEAVEAHETLATIYSGLHRRAEAALERQRAETLAAALDPGPRVNEQAPQFQLGDVNLRGLHADRPTVLVFGSYSCPNFRDSAEALKALYRKYRSQVSFLLVYIREAHANGSWQSSRNVRQQVTLEPASSLSEKQQHAAMCTRQLHLPFTTAVDGMDGAVEKAYQAWPSRVFIVGEDGRVLYRSRLTDQEFRPEELETVLKSAMR
jgi:tetratricopeptide (TPR) repeat protein